MMVAEDLTTFQYYCVIDVFVTVGMYM